MPKKTKKSKLIAEYRRKLQRMETGSPAPEHSHEGGMAAGAVSPMYSLPSVPARFHAVPAGPSSLMLSPVELTVIKHDLARTLAIVSAAIVLELILWRMYG